MGVDKECFVKGDNIPDHLVCKICFLVLELPIKLGCCFHFFCKDCVRDWFARNRTCPTCRAILENVNVESLSRQPDPLIVSLLKDEERYCSRRDQKCFWTGPSHRLQAHLADDCLVEQSSRKDDEIRRLKQQLEEISSSKYQLEEMSASKDDGIRSLRQQPDNKVKASIIEQRRKLNRKEKEVKVFRLENELSSVRAANQESSQNHDNGENPASATLGYGFSATASVTALDADATVTRQEDIAALIALGFDKELANRALQLCAARLCAKRAPPPRSEETLKAATTHKAVADFLGDWRRKSVSASREKDADFRLPPESVEARFRAANARVIQRAWLAYLSRQVVAFYAGILTRVGRGMLGRRRARRVRRGLVGLQVLHETTQLHRTTEARENNKAFLEQQKAAAGDAPSGRPPRGGGGGAGMGGGGGGAADANQQTLHARRLCVSGVQRISAEDLKAFFNQTIDRALHAPQPGGAVLSVDIKQAFAFVELSTVELATACMALDGLRIRGLQLRIRRPANYNLALLPPPCPIPLLDLSALGVVSSQVQDGPNKIFIGGLPYHLADEQVQELLSAFGVLKAFHLVREPGSATSKGYGFCEYHDPSVTVKACAGLNGMALGDKTLTVKMATNKAQGGGPMPHVAQTNAAGGAGGGGGGGAPVANQQTRHARRLYVGGVPTVVVSAEDLKVFFNQTIDRVLHAPQPGGAVLSVDIKQAFAFVELSTVELATACMALDGLLRYHGLQLNIRRPADYNPALLPPPGPIPQLDLSALGGFYSQEKEKMKVVKKKKDSVNKQVASPKGRRGRGSSPAPAASPQGEPGVAATRPDGRRGSLSCLPALRRESGGWPAASAVTPEAFHDHCKAGRAAEVAAVLEAGRGDPERLRALLEHKGVPGSNNNTPLHGAASEGHGEVVRLLLEARADCNARGEDGVMTPLHLAAIRGCGLVVRLLLEAGADRDARTNYNDDDGYTPLHMAARWGRGEVVRLLLEAGADRDARANDGRIALHMAAQEGNGEVVWLLLEAGADRDARANDGWTPLHMGAHFGRGEAVRLLLEAGADHDARANDGRIALHMAAQEGNGEVVRLLLEAGADRNARANDGWTPLHMAAYWGNVEVVRLLLYAGAQTWVKNNEGKTPLAEAQQKGYAAIVHLFTVCSSYS